MKILYFYQYFSTPRGSWGTRVYEFAREWINDGHEVTVVSSIYSKSDLKSKHFIENHEYDGIKVKVLNIYIDNKKPKLKRIWSFLQYAFVSTWYALTLHADVVIASSGPISVGIPGLAARFLRGRKLVFETRDLWPEGPIELGILKNTLLKKIAFKIQRKCYDASCLIVALSPGMRDFIKKNNNHANVISITNAANIDLFTNETLFHQIEGIQKKKYAIYTGNIGEVNNSTWLLNAARILTKMGRNDIKILLIGEGQQRIELVAQAKRENINNFIYHELMPKCELIPYIQNALVSLVPLKGTPILNTASPNKLFESLAAGVPVIQNTDGWMKELIDRHHVGFTIPADDAKCLANTLIELDANPSYYNEMKYNAILLAKSEFDKKVLSNRMLASIIHSMK